MDSFPDDQSSRSTPTTMTEVYGRMLNEDDDDSPDKCRERRRRRIQRRRLSSSPTGSPLVAAANSLREAAEPAPEALVPEREGKRPRVSDEFVQLTSSSSSSSGDEPDPPAPAERREAAPAYGTMSVTGRSREMEDAVDVQTPLCLPEITGRRPVHFFGVFDGHGGAHVRVDNRPIASSSSSPSSSSSSPSSSSRSCFFLLLLSLKLVIKN